MEQIRISCPICGPGDERKLFSCRDVKGRVDGEFQLVRCVKCGLVYMNPQPDAEMLEFFYSREKAEQVYYGGSTKEHAGPQVKLVKRFSQGTRLLDVGPGDGTFMVQAGAAGMRTTGIEFSAHQSQVLRDRLGLDVHAGTVESVPLESGSFDVVSMWDVLEHTTNPMNTLVAIHRLLVPGGLVIASASNIESVEARFFRDRWFRLDAPYHLFHFSPRTMRLMLERAGFKAEKIWCATTATGVLRSIAPKPDSSETSVVAQEANTQAHQQTGQSASPTKMLKNLVFNFGLVPALKILDAAGQGGSFISVGRKPV